MLYISSGYWARSSVLSGVNVLVGIKEPHRASLTESLHDMESALTRAKECYE